MRKVIAAIVGVVLCSAGAGGRADAGWPETPVKVIVPFAPGGTSDQVARIFQRAVQWHKSDTIVMGMIVIGLLWLAMDRLLFVPLERATIVRWGVIQR
jgi:tripartite-type tricarboxylate transporter receptor subunit TctC